MNILGLDTCFGACSVAVGVGLDTTSARTTEYFELMATGHAERLLPMVDEALDESGITLREIDRIAVTTGPGTFTGTRIGVAAARALAMSFRIPIVEFSSLEVMAHHHAIAGGVADLDLLVAMHPSRGEAYVQLFDSVSRAAKSAPMILKSEVAAQVGGDCPLTIVGSAATAVASWAGPRKISVANEDVLPRIGDIMQLASQRAPLVSPPRPLYLRPPDAKPQDGKSLPRAPI